MKQSKKKPVATDKEQISELKPWPNYIQVYRTVFLYINKLFITLI